MSFDGGGGYEFRVADPFARGQEQMLEWYYEQWIQHPFDRRELAQQAARSVREYGVQLFEQVFRDRAPLLTIQPFPNYSICNRSATLVLSFCQARPQI